MKFLVKGALVVNAAVFVLFGLAFLIAPDYFGALIDVGATSDTGHADIRSTYGGLSFSLGAIFAMALRHREFERVVLFLIALTALSMASFRLLSLLDGADLTWSFWAFSVAEVIDGTFALFLASRLSPTCGQFHTAIKTCNVR